jgi:carbamoyl-phosphate synthase large subunit
MLGKSLKEQGYVGSSSINHYAIKASVFPFLKLPGVDSILTPEMKSTGEVMGIDKDFDVAIYKALKAAGMKLPTGGGVYITVNDTDKPKILPAAKSLVDMGFTLYATKGTSTYLREHGVSSNTVFLVSEHRSPDAIGMMRRGEINLIINTPTESSGSRRDGYMMRRLAVELEIPFMTTAQGAIAAVAAIKRSRDSQIVVTDMNSYHV